MILFFDTETTGIRKGGFIPRVVQIGALLTDNDGKTVGELNLLLLPDGFENIPVEASNVHGFSTDFVKKHGVNRYMALSAFFAMMEQADTVVAHNAEYDMDLLQIETDYYKDIHNDAQAGTIWQDILNEAKVFCTMLNSRDLMKLPLSEAQASFFKDKGIDQKYKNPRLQEAHIHYMGYDFEGAHDAMADVRACKDVYFKLHSLKEQAA
jgi:DNA polymerase III epsilon subunit-like protein